MGRTIPNREKSRQKDFLSRRISSQGILISVATAQKIGEVQLDDWREYLQKGNQDSKGVQQRTSRQELERLSRSRRENFQREVERLRGVFKKSREMAINGLRDQDRLDWASNFVIWKAMILSILDRYRIKAFTLRIVVIPVDPADNEKYEEAMSKKK